MNRAITELFPCLLDIYMGNSTVTDITFSQFSNSFSLSTDRVYKAVVQFFIYHVNMFVPTDMLAWLYSFAN